MNVIKNPSIPYQKNDNAYTEWEAMLRKNLNKSLGNK